MTVVDQLRRFFGKEAIYENDVIVFQVDSSTAELLSLSTPLSEFAPKVKVIGALVSPSGTSRSLTIQVDYVNPLLPTDTLNVVIYSSSDGVTYNQEATYLFADLPVSHTTTGNYVIVSVETQDGKVLWTTKDKEKGLNPLDARLLFSNLELIDTSGNGGSLVASYPIFFNEASPSYLIDVSYRSLQTVTDSSNSIGADNDVAVIQVVDSVEMRIGSLYQYNNQPYENYFPKTSPHFIVTSKESLLLSLPSLVDAAVLSGHLSNLGAYFAETNYQTSIQLLNSLDTDPTTGLFYRSYVLTSPSSPTYVVNDSTVDIAWNVYLALRFLSSGLPELVDFVLSSGSGTTFLEKLGNLVNTADGTVLPDTDTQSDYMALTESLFFLLEKLVETEYPTYKPASFNSDATFATLETYVDLIGSIAYSSASERDGSPAPTARSLDLAALMYVFKNAPTTDTQNFEPHVSIIQARLNGFLVNVPGGVPENLDPNDPNYNPLWENLLPITGMAYYEGEAIVDSVASYFVLNLLPAEYSNVLDMRAMETEEGALRVNQADVATGRYIVPHLWSTSLKSLLSFSSSFIKASSYTVRVLDDQPVTVSITQVPTDVGVTLYIHLDIPSGIVARAVGVTTQTTYSSVAVLSQLNDHIVSLKIPNVSEDVYIDVFPLRPVA